MNFRFHLNSPILVLYLEFNDESNLGLGGGRGGKAGGSGEISILSSDSNFLNSLTSTSSFWWLSSWKWQEQPVFGEAWIFCIVCTEQLIWFIWLSWLIWWLCWGAVRVCVEWWWWIALDEQWGCERSVLGVSMVSRSLSLHWHFWFGWINSLFSFTGSKWSGLLEGSGDEDDILI